jgi:cytochrome b561
MSHRSTEGYTWPQIALHWVIAVLVVVDLLSGESMDEAMEGSEEGGAAPLFDQVFADIHYWTGTAILALTVLRLGLRAVSGAPSRLRQGWSEAAAALTHFAFYVLLIAMPVTGLLAFYVSDDFDDIHELGEPALIVLIALHTFAALVHHFWLRDETLKRMLVARPGRQGKG